uniref:Phospholipid/glycerol acyltransferase domain-containing protein n=1 Tax=Meloidogyne floridensis TaxID=298350 RepID=A0A915NSU6_9BILA
MFINSKSYSDFLSEIRSIGGEFTWIKKNNLGKIQNAGRSPKEIAAAIFNSERIKKVITDEAIKRDVKDDVVHSEAKQILSNMASDFHLHSAVQTIGYSLAKIFGRIFSHIWYNSEALEKIRKISYDRSVSIVWLPTHKSYLDFLLISLLCYHHQIQLPAICAAEDFQSSKLLGEALRRCGAFFIRRKFKEDPLYWAIFAEYIQQHLLHSDRPVEFFIEGQRSRTGKSLFPRTGLLQLVVELFMKAQVYDTLLVPITINYDRILEESLFSYELLGRPKPKESASGLLKTRQILSDSFGSIFITIGHPISLREYFLSGNINLEVRGELMKDKDILSYDNKLREVTESLALKIVSIQNRDNVLTIWSFIALAILKIINDHKRNSQEYFKINIAELNPVVEMLVGIFNKCFDGKEIYIEGLMIKDAIIFLCHLFNKEFVSDTNQIAENFDYAKMKCRHLSKPYLIAYHAIFELFLEMNNEKKFSNQNEFFTAIHQRLIFKINNGRNKLSLQIASIDLIKNGFNFLRSEQLIKLNQNERLLVDFAGIARILKKLDGILRLNFKEFNKELSLKSKI